jgi:uncharacterized cupin superfamily protein
MRTANVFTDGTEFDPADPDGFRAGMANVGREVGSEEFAIKLFDVPPGESICPYHYEYVEEFLLVLEGTVVVRTPDGELEVPRGGLVRFAKGPEGAHKVTNRVDQTARVLMFSSSHEPSVAVYPDSDKIGVWPGNPDDTVMVRRADGHVNYYEGER